jgi:uncharacterized protein
MLNQTSRDDLIKYALFAGAVSLALLAVFLFSKTIAEVITLVDGDDARFVNTITVTGEGEETAVPDIASFSFSVVETLETPEKAQLLATKKSNEATELLRNNGVDEKDIKTTGYNVYPQYSSRPICNGFNCPVDEPQIIGYQVNQSTSVKVRNSDDAGRILAELGRIGVSNISGLNFSIDEPEIYKKKARDKAIANAKQEAEELAKSLGVKLDDIVSFSEHGGGFPFFQEDFGISGARTLEAQAVPELPKGENTFSSTVSITFEIE